MKEQKKKRENSPGTVFFVCVCETFDSNSIDDSFLIPMYSSFLICVALAQGVLNKCVQLYVCVWFLPHYFSNTHHTFIYQNRSMSSSLLTSSNSKIEKEKEKKKEEIYKIYIY
jgi:hypothetical protein